MTAADNIVDNLVEGRKTNASRLIKQALGWDMSTRMWGCEFAFAIGVNFDESSMSEDGINHQDVNWTYEGEQLTVIERNVIYALQELGMSVRSDGHDNNGDLVGGAWINYFPPRGVEAMKFMGQYLEGPDEPMRTSSGTLPSFITNRLYANVSSELAKRYTDVELSFYKTEKLQRFFELLNSGLTPDEVIDTMANEVVSEAYLGAPEPSGVFRSELGGRTTFSAKCPGCKRIHGNFRTFEQAAGNKMCRYCIRGYVDKITKVRETGNFKTLLRKRHDKARH